MYMLFLDESGSINSQESNVFILGGIIISEYVWHDIRTKVCQLKEKYAIPATEEIKWRYFYPKARNTVTQHLSIEQKNALRDELYNVLLSFPSIKAMSVVAQLNTVNNLDKETLYLKCYQQIVEQFHNFLTDSSNASGSKVNGIIICDHMDTSHNNKIKHHHNQIILNDQAQKYEHVIECLFLVDSFHSLGVQLADLVIGAQFRMLDKNDNRFYEKIKELFERNEKWAEIEIGGN